MEKEAIFSLSLISLGSDISLHFMLLSRKQKRKQKINFNDCGWNTFTWSCKQVSEEVVVVECKGKVGIWPLVQDMSNPNNIKSDGPITILIRCIWDQRKCQMKYCDEIKNDFAAEFLLRSVSRSLSEVIPKRIDSTLWVI